MAPKLTARQFSRRTCRVQNRSSTEFPWLANLGHFTKSRKNTERYRIDWPLFGPQCVLARRCELGLKGVWSEVLRFELTPASSCSGHASGSQHGLADHRAALGSLSGRRVRVNMACELFAQGGSILRACTRCIHSPLANPSKVRLKVASLGHASRRLKPHRRRSLLSALQTFY